jgi:hypothetical protein
MGPPELRRYHHYQTNIIGYHLATIVPSTYERADPHIHRAHPQPRSFASQAPSRCCSPALSAARRRTHTRTRRNRNQSRNREVQAGVLHVLATRIRALETLHITLTPLDVSTRLSTFRLSENGLLGFDEVTGRWIWRVGLAFAVLWMLSCHSPRIFWVRLSNGSGIFSTVVASYDHLNELVHKVKYSRSAYC